MSGKEPLVNTKRDAGSVDNQRHEELLIVYRTSLGTFGIPACGAVHK